MNIAILGCGETARLHAEAARAAGHSIVVCGVPEEISAKASKAFGRNYDVPTISAEDLLVRPDDWSFEILVLADLDGDGRTDSGIASISGATVISDRGVYFGGEQDAYFDVSKFHIYAPELVDPGLTRLANSLTSEVIGDVGFVRYRHTVGTPSSRRRRATQGARMLLSDLWSRGMVWLSKTVGPIDEAFGRIRYEPRRAQSFHATCTFKNGAIADVVSNVIPGNTQRIECEIGGTKGLLQYDSAEHVYEPGPYNPASTVSPVEYAAWESEQCHAFWRAWGIDADVPTAFTLGGSQLGSSMGGLGLPLYSDLSRKAERVPRKTGVRNP